MEAAEDADMSAEAAAGNAAEEHSRGEDEEEAVKGAAEDADMSVDTAAENPAEEQPPQEGKEEAEKEATEDADMSAETTAENPDEEHPREEEEQETAMEAAEDADMSAEAAAANPAEEHQHEEEELEAAKEATEDADVPGKTAAESSEEEQAEEEEDRAGGDTSAQVDVEEEEEGAAEPAGIGEEVGEDAEADAAQPSSPKPEDAGPAGCEGNMEDSMAFTPKEIQSNLCKARIWNSGHGGQCSMVAPKDGDFCGRHRSGWKVHGRVDGPIPEAKLKEFQRFQKRLAKAKGSEKGAKAGKDGRDSNGSKKTPKKEAAASAGERCKTPSKGSSRTSTTKSTKKSRVSTSSRSSRSSPDVGDEPTSSKVQGKRLEVLSDEETTAEENAEKRATRNLKRKRQATPKANKVDARASKAARKTEKAKTSKPKETKKSERKADKAWKCTCGKPFHTEKCKLFRPSFLHSSRFPRASSRSRFMASPKKRRETLPPPSVQLSRTASEQVVKISAEIEQLPKDQRRSAWKNQMRMYHPDKKSVFPNLSEEQMNEVFVEIKRRYDFAARQQQEDLVPPARQFWGSAR